MSSYNYEIETIEAVKTWTRIWLELQLKVQAFCFYMNQEQITTHSCCFYVKLITPQKPSFFKTLLSKGPKNAIKIVKAQRKIVNLESNFGTKTDFYLFTKDIVEEERTESMLSKYTYDAIMKGKSAQQLMKEAVDCQDTLLYRYLLKNWQELFSFGTSIHLIKKNDWTKLSERLAQTEMCKCQKKVKKENQKPQKVDPLFIQEWDGKEVEDIDSSELKELERESEISN